MRSPLERLTKLPLSELRNRHAPSGSHCHLLLTEFDIVAKGTHIGAHTAQSTLNCGEKLTQERAEYYDERSDTPPARAGRLDC
jgi:hypothetical protein